MKEKKDKRDNLTIESGPASLVLDEEVTTQCRTCGLVFNADDGSGNFWVCCDYSDNWYDFGCTDRTEESLKCIIV